MIEPDLTVVVVTYQAADFIVECLTPLGGVAGIDIRVIDNASTDSTVALVQNLMNYFPNIKLVETGANLGFAKAANIGIEASRGDVLLLNPDAVISDSDIQILGRAARDAEVGVVAPVVDNGAGNRVMSAGRLPSLWPQFTHLSGLSQLFPRNDIFRGRHLYLGVHDGRDQEVEWVSGGCMYICRRALTRVGKLSERWFMYGEDIDFCKRVIDAGLRILVISEARASHRVGASINAEPGPVNTLWASNTYDFYVKAYKPGMAKRLFWRLIFSAGLLIRVFVWRFQASRSDSLAQREKSRRFLAYALAVWRRAK